MNRGWISIVALQIVLLVFVIALTIIATNQNEVIADSVGTNFDLTKAYI